MREMEAKKHVNRSNVSLFELTYVTAGGREKITIKGTRATPDEMITPGPLAPAAVQRIADIMNNTIIMIIELIVDKSVEVK